MSLIPATTELLLSAGLGSTVVGRSQWCDWPQAAAAIPSVGQAFPPNLEAVVSRRPDLVVLYHTAGNAHAAGELRALGIPVVRVRTDRVADLPRAARMLGALTGAGRALNAVALEFTRALADASAQLPAGPPVRPLVLLLAWPDPLIALGAGSFMSELVELAGGRNAFADVPTASVPVSLEAVVARDPDIVFLADSAARPVLARPEWQTVRAVRTGRVVAPLAPALTRAGLRAPAAVRQLRGALTLSSPKTHP